MWVGIPHWASLWYKPVFLKEPQNVQSTDRLFGTLQVPREGPLLFYLCAVNFIVRFCHSQVGSEILFNLATLNLVLFVIQE